MSDPLSEKTPIRARHIRPGQGQAVEVKSHRVEGAVVTFELWQAMPEPLAAGDTFFVTAGCSFSPKKATAATINPGTIVSRNSVRN